MPRQIDADAVLLALSGSERPMSTAALETVANVRRTRLELLLKVLAVEGAVDRVAGGWRATGKDWIYDAERYDRVAEARRSEQDAMRAYQGDSGCRMAFLQRTLDDETAVDCGRCDVCAGEWYPRDVPDTARSAARTQLERAGVGLDVRAQWPTGMSHFGMSVSGRIPPAEQYEPGRSLARLSDLGWGSRLRDLFAAETPDVEMPADLIRACVGVLAQWGWAQRPAAVIAMPSRHRPLLVASLARSLAELGRLEDLGSLDLVDGGPSGGPGGNSAFRLAGVWGRFAVPAETARRLAGLDGAPVLLVDDLVESRWSLTVAARELRRAGAGAVLPFALATSGSTAPPSARVGTDQRGRREQRAARVSRSCRPRGDR